MMAEVVSSPKWLGRIIFAGCAFILIALSLVPFNFDAPRITPPDLLFALTLAVILRRPDFAPFASLTLIFVLADILQMRPIGLWAAIMLAVCAFSRPQEYRFRELTFLLEWAFIALMFLVSLLAYRLVLLVSFVPQVNLPTTLIHFGMTVLTYPLVVFFCHFVLRVRKFTPEQATRLGQRL